MILTWVRYGREKELILLSGLQNRLKTKPIWIWPEERGIKFNIWIFPFAKKMRFNQKSTRHVTYVLMRSWWIYEMSISITSYHNRDLLPLFPWTSQPDRQTIESVDHVLTIVHCNFRGGSGSISFIDIVYLEGITSHPPRTSSSESSSSSSIPIPSSNYYQPTNHMKNHKKLQQINHHRNAKRNWTEDRN